MPLIISLAIGAVAGCLLGLLLGWLLRGREEVTVEKIVTNTIEKIVEKVPDDLVAQRDQAALVLAQLEQLAMGVSADISAHNRTVGDINEELSHTEDGEGTVVTTIRKLIESNSAMQSKLEDAQVKLQTQAQQLQTERETARTDQLTKLRNRRAFDDELQRKSVDFQQRGTPLSLMLIDVDHFKKFNDQHGHLAGDEVLRSVGRVLTEHTFGKEGLFPARYGGEEFAVVFSGYKLEAVSQIADRIRGAIGEQPVVFEGKNLQVNASAGISMFTAEETLASFIARADEALYASKKSGRNCAHVHREGTCVKVEKPVPVEAAPVTMELLPGENLVPAISRRIAEWKRGGNPISVIVAKVDNLSQIEATKGVTGVLQTQQAVLELLRRSLREMDAATPWLGELFSVMLPTAKLVDAARVAERIRMGIEQGELDELLGTHISVSFGVAEVCTEDDGDGLLLRARRAVEQARRKGGNVVYIHDGRQTDPASDRLDLAAVKWAVAT